MHAKNNMKSLILVAALSIVLVGCAAPTPKIPNYQLPANLTTPCEELPPLQNGSLGDLYKYTVEIATLYNQCAIKHDALSQAVKK
jgi:uncharacterized lipoprotein YmbA